jgi:type IV secretory pathway VirJ component
MKIFGLCLLISALMVSAAIAEDSIPDLPLIEINAKAPERDSLVLLITGDGGFSAFDKGVSRSFADDGIPVVAVNALKYFWTKRTPESTAADMARVLRAYKSSWHKTKILLVGYSFGAEVMPFVYNRLPGDIRKDVVMTVLLGASPHADFEFHVTYWAHLPGSNQWPVLPELEKMRGQTIMVIYGEDEKDTLAKELPPGLCNVVALKGGHHFGNDYEAIEKTILRENH